MGIDIMKTQEQGRLINSGRGDDFKKPERTQSTEEEGHKFFDKVFIVLTFACYIGTIFMPFNVDKFYKRISYAIPEGYQMPSFSDFYITLASVPIFALIKVVFEKLVSPLMWHIISYKY